MRIKLYKGNYRISSPYGNRRLDNGDNRFHSGIDYVGTDSKEIIAPTNGKIVSSQIITDKNNPTWEWGNYVKMDDLNGFYLFFCHLSSRNVKAGQTVAKGQIIGLEGQTGYSLGSHLHFEVRRKSDNTTINPEQYFKILFDWYKNAVKKKYGFDDSTMDYLSKHPYPDALFEKLLK
jgi:murein DD-endopeptidase MepM/ murein hydrolase activator NlpD